MEDKNQLKMPFWDNVIDKKKLRNKQQRQDRRAEWLQKNIYSKEKKPWENEW